MTSEATAASTDVRLKHVLVPLDGSELALQAMPTARALAERFSAVVHTVSVAGNDDDTARLRALAAAVMGVNIDDDRVRVATDGDPADGIANYAEQLDPCVVCMSTHGRGRLRGAVVGSVARSVVQRSPNAVVVLGPVADNPGWSPRPRSWPEPLSIPRIVACVDGTETSEQVLPLAAAWARTLAMSLTILTVIEDAPSPVRRGSAPTRYGSSGDADTYIAELVERWHETVPDTGGEVVRDPISAASGIRSYLDHDPAGLVALTTHARSGLQRALFGADAASIVHASVAPCLVAPVRP